MTFEDFCLWTNMDSEDVMADIAYHDFTSQTDFICEWWAEFQGRYV